MKKHDITTSKGEFVAKSMLGLPLCTSGSVKMFDFQTNIHIINGVKYECLCKLSEATEEDAKGVVDEKFFGGIHEGYEKEYAYMNYNSGVCNMSFTALESLRSLLKSKGIDINNGNWYLFKKI